MGIDNSHIIHKVFVEVDTNSLTIGNQFKDSFLDYLKDKILPLLDTKLTEISSKNEGYKVRIPHVEIDVSVDQLSNFRGVEFDVVTKVEKKIQRAVEHDLLESSGLEESVLISSNRNKEDFFKEFLISGASPWWKLDRTTNFESRELIEFVKPEYLQKKEVRERFIKQFSNKFLLKTILNLINSSEKSINSLITPEKVEKIYIDIIEKNTDLKQRFLVWDILFSEQVRARDSISFEKKMRLFLYNFMNKNLDRSVLLKDRNESKLLSDVSHTESLEFREIREKINSRKNKLQRYLVDKVLKNKQPIEMLFQISQEIKVLQKEFIAIESKLDIAQEEGKMARLTSRDKFVDKKKDTVTEQSNLVESELRKSKSEGKRGNEQEAIKLNLKENQESQIIRIVTELKAYMTFISKFKEQLSMSKNEPILEVLKTLDTLLLDECAVYFSYNISKEVRENKTQDDLLFKIEKIINAIDAAIISNEKLGKEEAEEYATILSKLIALVNELNVEIKKSIIEFLEKNEIDTETYEFSEQHIMKLFPERHQKKSNLLSIDTPKNKVSERLINRENQRRNETNEVESELTEDFIHSEIKTQRKKKQSREEQEFKKNEVQEVFKDNEIGIIKEEILQLEKEILSSKSHQSSILDLGLKTDTYVENAGVILAHPFLKYVLLNTKLYDEKTKKITNPEKAIHLIHFVATGKEQDLESNMIFEKIICGIPPNQPINRFVYLSEEDKKEADNMLQAVLSNWEKMNNASNDLLRHEFFNRNGKLTLGKRTVSLKIERKPQDILLNKINWNMSMVKLPWLTTMIQVEW
ncbi:hypothetical protein SAMN04489761_2388 [Tenacibaculum sp. MAR_2009_124]|uniref:contractile injection system tape measure protein n=1 Tax=Tenacibaculum sp. MAR_2009_124 TaxID=1250059 RepID=UPI000898013A|nr:contractile injection system tape measure protein [Tenacibaculum sp. MAR_2009_124]SEC21194.1 hypothetical protein SAMN04489761_2388 [Tenacibaculum sp. MAR_2009_124]